MMKYADANPGNMSVFQAKEGRWKAMIPSGWIAWEELECANFADEGGVGAIQISSYEKGADVNDADLRDLAREILGDSDVSEVKGGDFIGFECSFEDGDNYWRHWYLRCGTVMLFATYNCELSASGIEAATVDEFISTLQR